MRDEELAAAGILPVESHADGAAQIGPLIELVSNRIARTTLAVSAWVAILDDKVGHDAVKGNPVEEALARQRDEVGDCQRRIEHCQLELDGPLIGVDKSSRRIAGRHD